MSAYDEVGLSGAGCQLSGGYENINEGKFTVQLASPFWGRETHQLYPKGQEKGRVRRKTTSQAFQSNSTVSAAGNGRTMIGCAAGDAAETRLWLQSVHARGCVPEPLVPFL